MDTGTEQAGRPGRELLNAEQTVVPSAQVREGARGVASTGPAWLSLAPLDGGHQSFFLLGSPCEKCRCEQHT